ncbi:MAG: nucleotidyltransferase domain-containing protein [Cyanobacteria bacterium HKST-UBA02]|nr:nucleotidyltransferase domain-containing protein [Cyanobacteria bacterium HKST-UBA02]
MTDLPPVVRSMPSRHPHPLLFATVSGAHLYGFPSPDSDYDLRGVHILPLADVVGLEEGSQTVESMGVEEGIELDLVTHDVKKFFKLLLKKNGYVLEQLYSPIVVHSTSEHEELKAIARDTVTRHHYHHYRGFAATQLRLFQKESPPRVKPLLYIYRVLLTGINLLRTGEIEANLVILNESFALPQIPDLIARKLAGAEHQCLDDADMAFHLKEYERLSGIMEEAFAKSVLPEAPGCRDALDDLLIRIRMAAP